MNQYQLNKNIEQFIDEKTVNNKKFTAKDIEYINQYTGYGGLQKFGATGRKILDEYFTPEYVCELMVKLAFHHGFKTNGKVLEPSCGTGNFIKYLPNQKNVTAFEINNYSAQICKINYPKIDIYEQEFETSFLDPEKNYRSKLKKQITWLKNYPFDLVIGNPPYGDADNIYTTHFRKPSMVTFTQFEMFFIYYGLKLLKPGGLLIYITATNFLSTGQQKYEKAKTGISEVSNLIDAYRLPPLFVHTKVPTDILIFKKI